MGTKETCPFKNIYYFRRGEWNEEIIFVYVVGSGDVCGGM